MLHQDHCPKAADPRNECCACVPTASDMLDPIEAVAAALNASRMTVEEVLVPEQCLLVFIGDKCFNLTLEELDQ